MIDWGAAIDEAMERVNVAYTGINGWVNFDSGVVHFTPRCNHTEWLKEVRYYDGTRRANLKGVVGNYHDQHEDGGAAVRGNSADLYDIYSWAAVKFGWRQFIDKAQHEKDSKKPRLQIFGQEHVEGVRFARMCGSPVFTFKDDYVWPRHSVRG